MDVGSTRRSQQRPGVIIWGAILATLVVGLAVVGLARWYSYRPVAMPVGIYKALNYDTSRLAGSSTWIFSAPANQLGALDARNWTARTEPSTRYELDRKSVSRTAFESAIEASSVTSLDVTVEQVGRIAALNIPPQPYIGPH